MSGLLVIEFRMQFLRADLIIINVHSPTEDKDDKVKDEFYYELESMFDKLYR